jgi:hypothetical protein
MAIDYSIDSGATWIPLGCFSDGNISKTRDKFESTCGLDANKQYVKGKPDFSGSSTYVWDSASDDIIDAVDSDDPILARIYPNKPKEPTKYFEGLINIDMTMAFGKDVVKGTINISAAGDIAWH